MFFTLSLQGGGAERVIASLSNEMAKKNEVIIVTVHNSKDHYELDKSIKRICLDKKLRNDKSRIKNKLQKISPRRVKELASIIGGESPDIVIAFLPLPSLYIMMTKHFSKKVRRIPVILSERADPKREYHNIIIFTIMKKLFKYADGFVFQTEEAEHFYSGIINCKTEVIANPINESFLNHKLPAIRRKVVVSCGRLEEQKNYKLLISSFAKVVEDYPDYSLEIYGEGSKKDELIEYAEELGVGNKVHIMGRVKEIVDKIIDAGLFVLSSDYEGMPNALMEAMALGIPCISTDCPVGGPKALIKNGHNGILVDVGNEEELSNKMVEIISNTRIAIKLSRNEIDSVKEYSVEKIAAKWKAFVQSVLFGQ